MKLKVGMTVYLKAVGNNARRNKEVHIVEETVVKVGRKYFQVGDGHRPWKFLIEDLTQETGGYVADWELYFSRQDILDEEEARKLCSSIQTAFIGYGKPKQSLDQLRRIKAILDEDKNIKD